ncbi:MAG: hypothetical protein V4555_21335 [Acidobacteriota bacterium]
MTGRGFRLGAVVAVAAFGLGGIALRAQTPSVRDVVNTMIARELDEESHKPPYSYLSVERSDRTGGHAWTEHVVETPIGRVRFLMAIDGQALSQDQSGRERGRLADVVADPDAFEKQSAAQKDEEVHARQMLTLLTKGFVLENMREQGPDWRIDFRPDPAYSPSGMEAKVLHGMTGYMLVDRKDLRLHHIEGRLPQDESLAMGLVTVHAGSNFATTKADIDGHWRTVHVVSDIRAKAVIKSIVRNQEVTRSALHALNVAPNVVQAVAMAEEPVAP